MSKNLAWSLRGPQPRARGLALLHGPVHTRRQRRRQTISRQTAENVARIISAEGLESEAEVSD
ncbi:hypothetical protein ACILG0_00835 [Pseudomonadota bacterium AL_CKDN230030165-1A_HGKHYDSX7]